MRLPIPSYSDQAVDSETSDENRILRRKTLPSLASPLVRLGISLIRYITSAPLTYTKRLNLFTYGKDLHTQDRDLIILASVEGLFSE